MWKRTFITSVVLLIVCAFLWGPLLAWSPWKPGLDTIALQRADVYYTAGSTLPSAYREIDTYIQGAEQFLQLSAPKRLTVILCRDWSQFRRLMPHMRSTGLGGVTLVTGTAIYITPKLDERGFDHGEFLRHEITHAVTHQNQTLLNSFRYGKVEWLCEGTCVLYGRQRSYLSREEFLARAATTPLLPVIDPDQRPPSIDMRFAYPTWRYFNEFLMAQDRSRYQRFFVRTIADPPQWRTIFEQEYSRPFDAAVAEFEKSVR